jgi:polynucleotide kinase-phosphatase
MHGRVMPPVQEFALYGETTGERDEFNLPVRHNWAQEYKGGAVVVYGHVAVLQAVWINNTIDIDTGCVYGNKLTALRYPERELVSVPAEQVYYAPIRPLERNMPEMNEIKIIKDKYALSGDDFPRVIIHKENIAAALEVMSRFAVHPKWLVYLPPTMSPPDISNLDGFLEHPLEAFEYYRSAGLSHLICEEKHMGTRVCLVIARDEAAIERRFQIEGEGCGKCYTRTGRNYFTDSAVEEAFLQEASALLSKTNFWEEFETDWAVFDCEMMPWSYKYGKLAKSQYAAISSAAKIMLSTAEKYIEQGTAAGLDLSALAENIGRKKAAAQAFKQTYRGYCREVEDLSGLKLAPFHLLAVEGRTFFNKNHQWHLEAISLYCQGELFQTTPHIQVDLTDNASMDAAVDWWLKITAAGSEGMVVKPFDYIARDGNKIYQPAIKCRGREHLRLIYGAEYLFPSNLKRLKARKLKKKRSLAVKEFTSGIRGLSRFVRNEALDLVHDAVFAVLALESEDVDPQL